MKKISLLLLMAFIGMSLQQVNAQSTNDTAGHVKVKNKVKGHKVKTKLKGEGAASINAATPKSTAPVTPTTVIVSPPPPATVIVNPPPPATITKTETRVVTPAPAVVPAIATTHTSKTVVTKTTTHATGNTPVHHKVVVKKTPATTVKTSTTVTKTDN